MLRLLSNSIDKAGSLKDWIEYFLRGLEIERLLKDSEALPDELDNLKNLKEEVSEDKYKNYDTNKFSKLGKPENQIIITTRHSSKGLEFEVVVMMGMEEKHFPSWKAEQNPIALKEENRICFVCVSRAKRVCILMNSMFYDEMDYCFGEVRTKQYDPSRFYTN